MKCAYTCKQRANEGHTENCLFRKLAANFTHLATLTDASNRVFVSFVRSLPKNRTGKEVQNGVAEDRGRIAN